MLVLSTAGNSCCLNLMTHLAKCSACSAASENCTLPFFLPHPYPSKFKIWRKRLQSLFLQVSIYHLFLTLPFRPDWNCLILQLWPHPLLQHPVNSPFKLSFYTLLLLKLPLIFPRTVCLEIMTIGDFKPCLDWANQRKMSGNTRWAGIPPFPAEQWALAVALQNTLQQYKF